MGKGDNRETATPSTHNFNILKFEEPRFQVQILKFSMIHLNVLMRNDNDALQPDEHVAIYQLYLSCHMPSYTDKETFRLVST